MLPEPHDLKNIISLKQRRTGRDPLLGGDDGGIFDDMDRHDIHGRLSKLEGGNTALLWAVSVVSAILIGGMAIVWSDVTRLGDKVEALPAAIRTELQDLNRNMLEAIRVGQEMAPARQDPTVIMIPPGTATETQIPPTP